MSPRRALAVALVTASVLAPLEFPAGPAAAATPGACPTNAGVTVVVDFARLGGGVVVGCAPGAPTDGFAALAAAGFAVERVRTQPGFVCRIDGRPTADQCVTTPPANAYWSYWHAGRGGAWTYSAEGAASRTPPQGSVEGWVFSDGRDRPPSVPPPAPSPRPVPRPAAAAPAPAAPATPAPTAPPKAPPSSRLPVAPTPASAPPPAPGEQAPTTTRPGAAPTTTAGAAPGPGGPTTATPKDPPAPPVDDVLELDGEQAAAAGSAGRSGGSPAGTIVGLGLVAAVAAAALAVGRRRSARAS